MSRELGSMTVVMSAAVAIVAVVAVAVAGLATLFAARAQAQTGADAAALAAAVSTYPPASAMSPVLAARRGAVENGSVMVTCRCPRNSTLRSRTVEVVTAVRANVPVFGSILVRASSRAEFDPIRWLGP